MNIVKLKNKAGEEIAPITSSKAVFDENGKSVYQSQKDLEGKASQVYENLAAIEASNETDPNKIYIDGETMQPYIYKGGEFVPFIGSVNYSINDIYIPNDGRNNIDSLIEENGILYIGVHGGNILAYDIKNDKVLWSQTSTHYANNFKGITILGDYVYEISRTATFLCKRYKSTGAKIIEVNISYLLNYQSTFIGTLGGNLYIWGALTKTLYKINTDDLSFEPSGLYDGQIEGVDFGIDKENGEFGVIYTTDKHIIWLGSDLSEITNADASELTKLTSSIRVRCGASLNQVLIASSINTLAAKRTELSAIADTYVNTKNVGTLLCMSKVNNMNVNSVNIAAICSYAIKGASNQFFDNSSVYYSVPFAYVNAINCNNKVYFINASKNEFNIKVY